MSKKLIQMVAVAALTAAASLPALAGDMNNALGGALGGVAGAALGGAVGGSTGAVIGGAVGGGAGSALGGNVSRSNSYADDYSRGYHGKRHKHRHYD